MTQATVSPGAEVEKVSSDNPFVEVPVMARRILLAFLAVYAALVTIMPIVRAWESGSGMVAVGISNLVYIGGLSLPVLFWRRDYGWTHPLVFAALYGLLRVVLRKTGLFLGGMPEHIMLPDYDTEALNYLFAYGNFVDACAAVAMFVGFHSGPRWPVPRLSMNEPRGGLLIPMVVIAVLVSIVAFFLYIQIFGGLQTHLLNMTRGTGSKLGVGADEEAFGHYTFCIKIAAIVGMILVARNAGALTNPLVWPICLYSLLVGYLVDGKRSTIVNSAILLGIAWVLRNRRLPYLRVAALGVACFFVLGILGLYRWANWSRTDQVSFEFLSEVNTEMLTNSTFNELSQRAGEAATYYPILAKVPREVDMLYGKSYLEWGLRFVPRAVWPDKPRGVDVQAARAFYGVEWGMPATSTGEAYWNLLLPGVLLVFFMYGCFLRWLGSLVLAYPGSTAVIVFYSLSLFHFEPAQNGFRSWIYAVLPAVVILCLAGYVSRGKRLSASDSDL